jgi:acyl carrier protein
MLMATHDRLEDIVRQLFNDDTIVLRDEMAWRDVPGWDSLAHVNLIFGVEQAFGIRFSDEELDDVRTVGDLKRILIRRGHADRLNMDASHGGAGA